MNQVRDIIKNLAEMEQVEKLNPQETEVPVALHEAEVDHQGGGNSHWAGSAF